MADDRSILHMDLDTFYVSVERLLDSRLEGRPILLGGTSDRGVVASCSYETRAFGVHSGMPMRMARQLCPEAVVIRGESAVYTKYSKLVSDIIRERVPVFEKASIDEFYADLSGMDRFFGCARYAGELREAVIRESGLPISFGLSANKTVSKIATGEAKPNGRIHVAHGTEKPFLGPLSVRRIPMVGEKMFRSLCDLGVRRIRTLQEMPGEMMRSVFGKQGTVVWRKANGIDDRPVIPYHERKSISTERTFERDTIDIERLRSLLTAMAENLAFQLRRGGRLTACVTVKVRYADFNTHTVQRTIPYTAADHVLISTVRDLFESLYDKRLLVRLVGVRFSHLVTGHCQIDLFNDSEERVRLYQAMDALRLRHGERCVTRALTVGRHSSIGRFSNPFNGDPPTVLAHRRA